MRACRTPAADAAEVALRARRNHSLLEAVAASHHDQTLSDRSNPADAEQLFDVVVVRFESRAEDPVAGLRRLFGLELDAARALVTRLPATVRRNVNSVRAEYFRRALLSIGALVEVRRPDGSLVEAVEPQAPAPLQVPTRVSQAPVAAEAPETIPRARLANRQRTLLQGAAALPGAAVANDVPAPLLQPEAVSGELSLQLETNREPGPPSAAAHGAVPALAGLMRWDDAGASEVASHEPALELETNALPQPALRPPSKSPPVAAASSPASARPHHPGSKRVFEPAPVSTRPRANSRKPEPPRTAAVAQPESFWDGVSECLPLPMRGAGFGWLGAITVWVGLGNALAGQLAGIVWLQTLLALFVNLVAVVLCAEFHRECLAAVVEDSDEIDDDVATTLLELLSSRRRNAVELAIFAAVLVLPILVWCSDSGLKQVFDVLQLPRFWTLAVLLGVYWPAALASLNRAQGAPLWQVGVGMRAIARAPLEYLGCVFFGSLAFALPWLTGLIVVKILGLSTAAWAAVAGLPLALSHGVLGALAGLWIRSKPKVFDG